MFEQRDLFFDRVDNSSPSSHTIGAQTASAKRRHKKMRHSRTMMAARAAAVAVVSLSASTASSTASAFVATPTPFSASCPGCSSTTPGTPGTAVRYMPLDQLEQVSDFYQNFPLQSAVLTCGVKASVADTIAQVKPQIEENNQYNEEQIEREALSRQAASSSLSTLQQHHHHNDHPHQQHMAASPAKGNHNRRNSIDWEARRNLAYVLYGGIFVGLMSHIEYTQVFPFIFGNEKTLAITVEKVFFDNLVAAPLVWLPPAYFIKAWVYGASSPASAEDDASASLSPFEEMAASAEAILQEGLDKYLVDVKDNDLLWKYWTIWFPAQSVSFSVVPDHLRVAFMASISFFWFILFSTVSSQGDSTDDATTAAATTD